MVVLVVGPAAASTRSSARSALARSAPEVLCAPGNAGIRARRARRSTRPATPRRFGRGARGGVDLVVVGPEAPLVAGLVDALADARRAAASARARRPPRSRARRRSPRRSCARRASRPALRAVCRRRGGLAAITRYPARAQGRRPRGRQGRRRSPPTRREAREALEAMLVDERASATSPSWSRSTSTGDEVSLLALCDGERAVPLAPARDYKRIGDGDTGPEHGRHGLLLAGAGARAETRRARSSRPSTSRSSTSCARRGTPFHGVLYAGLMLDRRRPEGARVQRAASAIPRRRSCCRGCAPTCSTLLLAATEPGGLAGAELEWDPRAAVTRRARLARLPGGRRRKGDVITRPRAASPDGVEVFHAGTAERDGDVVTAGGRVLNVTALGDDVGRRAGGRLCCRRHDHLRRPPAAAGHRGAMSARHATTDDAEAQVEAEFDDSRSTPRASASSWAPRATWRRWRRPARCSTSTASATRSGSCRPTAIPTWSPTTARTRGCAGCR